MREIEDSKAAAFEAKAQKKAELLAKQQAEAETKASELRAKEEADLKA